MDEIRVEEDAAERWRHQSQRSGTDSQCSLTGKAWLVGWIVGQLRGCKR